MLQEGALQQERETGLKLAPYSAVVVPMGLIFQAVMRKRTCACKNHRGIVNLSHLYDETGSLSWQTK